MAINGLPGSSGLNFNNINNTVYNAISTQEGNLRRTLETISKNGDGSVSQADMLQMQQQMQQWTILIDIQSTITKQIADSLKGVIQKAG